MPVVFILLCLSLASASDSSERTLGSSSQRIDPTSDGWDSSGAITCQSSRECKGQGIQYCCPKYAVFETVCPTACAGCLEDSQSERLSKLSRSKHYDWVFTRNGEICLSSCRDISKAFCGDSGIYKWHTYCKYVGCGDGTGIDGCHSDSDFDKPSCKECYRIFPNACWRGYSESSSSGKRLR